MARFDGTGPRGTGAMTGKGMGYCAVDVSERLSYGRGEGRGNRRRPGSNRGMGRCIRNRFYERGFGRYYIEDVESLLDNKDSLKDEKKVLEERLNSINSKLNDLKD